MVSRPHPKMRGDPLCDDVIIKELIESHGGRHEPHRHRKGGGGFKPSWTGWKGKRRRGKIVGAFADTRPPGSAAIWTTCLLRAVGRTLINDELITAGIRAKSASADAHYIRAYNNVVLLTQHLSRALAFNYLFLFCGCTAWWDSVTV